MGADTTFSTDVTIRSGTLAGGGILALQIADPGKRGASRSSARKAFVSFPSIGARFATMRPVS